VSGDDPIVERVERELDHVSVQDYDAWAQDYDAWAANMTEDDVGWYVSLAREADEPIVELAVGTGRVAIPIAEETGKRVIGIDASPKMLAIARERAGALPVELREGDMRDLALEEPVDLIICPARSLLHLPTWADRRRAFESVARALKPGGRFAWNALALSPVIAARHHGTRSEQADGRWEEVTYVAADSRIDLKRGSGDEEHGTVSLWWATKAEWEGLIDVSGLKVEALYGGFNKEPFDDQAVEFVWVVRKPVSARAVGAGGGSPWHTRGTRARV
jgi:SAM-dependent methyltransferase